MGRLRRGRVFNGGFLPLFRDVLGFRIVYCYNMLCILNGLYAIRSTNDINHVARLNLRCETHQTPCGIFSGSTRRLSRGHPSVADTSTLVDPKLSCECSAEFENLVIRMGQTLKLKSRN
jgi:hypothetical protein